MKPQSAKGKGRKFQQWVRQRLIEELDIHPEDIKSCSMGAGGDAGGGGSGGGNAGGLPAPDGP